VLLAEDDLGSQELTRRALEDDGLDVDLRVVEDGEEAMDYLLRRGRHADPMKTPRPDLVLLDLNMPRMDGKQVLGAMRAHDELRRIPVVVLTTSRREEDVVRSYDLGCNSYVSKPEEYDRFAEVIRGLRSYWLKIVTLPRG
jgi:CheY-like chemotaxis protein